MSTRWLHELAIPGRPDISSVYACYSFAGVVGLSLLLAHVTNFWPWFTVALLAMGPQIPLVVGIALAKFRAALPQSVGHARMFPDPDRSSTSDGYGPWGDSWLRSSQLGITPHTPMPLRSSSALSPDVSSLLRCACSAARRERWVSVNRRTAVLRLGSLLLALCGCQGPNYKPTAVSLDAGAIVRAQQKDDRHHISISVQIERVDGLFRYPAQQPRPFSTLLVDAGTRTFIVNGTEKSATPFYLDRADVTIRATLQPGHAYDLKAERRGAEMTFWIEESTTHELVGNRETGKVRTVLGPIGAFF